MLVVAANDIMVCVIRYWKWHQPIRVTWWEITVWCYVMSCHIMSYHVMSCHDWHKVCVRLVLLICTLTAASCCVRLLSDFLGLTCVHQNGMTALMYAVYGDCSRSVERLLDGGANTEISDVVCIFMTFDVMWCHIISYDIISYHIISHHIISYHIILYYIMLYHMISCHVMSDRLCLTTIWSSLHAFSDCIWLFLFYDQLGYTALRHATEMRNCSNDISVMMVLLSRGASTDTVDTVRNAVRWSDVIG